MQRCYLKTNGACSRYGAKGVTVDKEWHSLDRFIETVDLVEGFNLEELMNGNLQLDKDIKIKGNKVYSYKNCKFVTSSENNGNRPSDMCEFVAVSRDRDITFHTNREKFCRENNLDSSTVWRMLNRFEYSAKHNKSIPTYYKGWQFFYQNIFNESMIKNPRLIKATNIDTGEIKEFEIIKDFAEKHNLNTTSISACLHGRQNKAGRWIFEELRKGEYY